MDNIEKDTSEEMEFREMEKDKKRRKDQVRFSLPYHYKLCIFTEPSYEQSRGEGVMEELLFKTFLSFKPNLCFAQHVKEG